MPRESSPSSEKGKGSLGYLATLPIVLAIFSLVAELLLQSTFVLEQDGSFSPGYGSGLLFSSSGMMLFSLLGGGDMERAQGLMAIVNIPLSLAFLFLSSYAIKGKRICFLVPFLLYLADLIVGIVFLAMSQAGLFVLRVSVLDIVLNVMIHLLGLLGLGYAVYALYVKGKDKKKHGNEQDR